MLAFVMDTLPRESQPLLGMHRQRLHLPGTLATPTRAASRCLFGVVDPVAARAAYHRLVREETRRCIESWDFDPAAGKPVEKPKRYLWEKHRCGGLVNPPADGEVPEGERLPPPVVAAPLGKKENGLVDGDRWASGPLAVEAGSVPGTSPRGAGRCGEGGLSRGAGRFEPYQQRRITEYFRQRKSLAEKTAEGAAAAEGEALGAEDGQ
ncbi:uncharacterized protein [Hetaerina americana]|uniref:uncharacterized protein n=1 Tax=Hetaerina americana TaxID=62018 RepID=UPI003A7F4113